MPIQNPFYVKILIFLLNTGDGYALLLHGDSNGNDTTHGSGWHGTDVVEIKQLVLNLTAELENIRRQTDIIPALKQNLTVLVEEKKLLQNRVFFLEAELNKLNASKTPSSDELMAYLRGTKQLVQTLATNEEFDKNLTLRLNEAENNIAIVDKLTKNLTKRIEEVVNNLVINEKHNKNFTLRFYEIENILVKNDKQEKNVTKRLNEIHNILTANGEYDKNLTQQLTDSVNNLHDIKVQLRYTSLSLMDVHSKTDKLNTTLTTYVDDQIRDVYGRITNKTKKVAFTAGVTSRSTTWNSGTLVFDLIIYNIGGGYDSSTGVFTSPVDGHFVFFVNVQADTSHDTYTFLVLNGSLKVATMAQGGSGYNMAGPNLVVLRLQRGDRVWVRNWAGTGYYTSGSAHVTTFSGFLI